MKKMTKERKYKFLSSIRRGNHRFTDILEDLEWSKATISRYLKRFSEMNLIKKEITEDGSAGYFLTEEGENYRWDITFTLSRKRMESKMDTKEWWINNYKESKKKIQELKGKGIFEEQIDFEELIDFIQQFEELDHDIDKDKFTVSYLMSFLNLCINSIMPDSEIEGNIKLKLNPDKILERLDKHIEIVKEKGVKNGWPNYPEELKDKKEKEEKNQ